MRAKCVSKEVIDTDHIECGAGDVSSGHGKLSLSHLVCSASSDFAGDSLGGPLLQIQLVLGSTIGISLRVQLRNPFNSHNGRAGRHTDSTFRQAGQ